MLMSFIVDRAEAIADEVVKRVLASQTESGPSTDEYTKRAEEVRDALCSRGVSSELIFYKGRVGVSVNADGDGMFVDGHHDSYEPDALADEAMKIRETLAAQAQMRRSGLGDVFRR
jgi:hypothetical protein